MLIERIRTSRNRTAARLTAGLLCFTLTGLWMPPVFAAGTPSGTQISQTQARLTSTNLRYAVISNTPSTVTVPPIYGFSGNPFTATTTVPLSLAAGTPYSYNFSITNNGTFQTRFMLL